MFAKTYAKHYDLLYQDKRYKKDIAFIYKWAEKPHHILDIGCGTASYWKYFPQKTFITGIEKSQDMIDRSPHKSDIFCFDIMTAKPIWIPSDLVIAIFDVINYIPRHDWWVNLSLKPGGHFIFDIWDKKKVEKEGFRQTIKSVGGITRIINPISYSKGQVKLNVSITNYNFEEVEQHDMYIYSEADIKRFAGKDYKIVDKKTTETWQTWYKLQRS